MFQSDDDESRGETSFLSDADSMPPTPSSLPAPPTPSQDISQDGSFKVPQVRNFQMVFFYRVHVFILLMRSKIMKSYLMMNKPVCIN